MNPDLNAFARNDFSQYGEDGVLEELLRRLPEPVGWSVEFGAWDGKHLSNTFRLVARCRARCVMIEGNPEKFSDLVRTSVEYPGIIPVNRMVGFSETDHLDAILAGTGIPMEFDVLSIDIDSYDYHVWKAAKHYRPRVVCIEYNQTIPNEIEYVQPLDRAISVGSSVRALVNLGLAKGYELVCVTPTNAIFVAKEYFERTGVRDNRLEVLRRDETKRYVFIGFDGTVIYHGPPSMIWREFPMDEGRMQQFPRWFRSRRPGIVGERFRQWCYRVYTWYRRGFVRMRDLQNQAKCE